MPSLYLLPPMPPRFVKPSPVTVVVPSPSRGIACPHILVSPSSLLPLLPFAS